MKRLLFIILSIILCTNIFAAEIINAVPEDKKREFEERDLIRELGYDPDDSEEGYCGDVLHGPGIDEEFVAMCEFIKTKLKKGEATTEEKEKYYKWCGIPTPSNATQVANFSRKNVAKKEEAKEERNNEKEELTDEEKYGYIYLEIPDIGFSAEFLNKGSTTALSILQRAGVDFSSSASMFGGTYVTRIEGMSESTSAGWTYSVNGTMGAVAADKYKCKKGDTITWEYVTW